MPLEHTPVLTLVAEVAAAFVGFSYVVGALREDQPDAAILRVSMRGVAELALVAGGGALFVLVLDSFGFTSETSYRAASAVFAVVWSVAHFYASKRFRETGNPMSKTTNALAPLIMVLVGILLLMWNAVLPSAISGARFVSAVCLALAASALIFVFTTFAGSDSD